MIINEIQGGIENTKTTTYDSSKALKESTDAMNNSQKTFDFI